MSTVMKRPLFSALIKVVLNRSGILLTISLFFLATPAWGQTAELTTYKRYVKSGFEQLDAKNFQSARDDFDSALRYYQSDGAAYLGLGAVYFHLKDDRAAERALTRALELNPQEKNAYQIMGEMAYRRDDPAEAITAWEKALAIDPSDAALKARLDRIKKEHRTEQYFNREVTGHFLIKYEGRERIDAGRIILRILEDAYGEVGRALSFYPDQEIQVILYSGQQFREVTDAPGWSGGIYDGKIRLPIGGIDQETPGLRRLLFHEYTHAVVRAITRRVPTWVNEGLAQYFEGRSYGRPEREGLSRLALAGKLPPLAMLEGSFMGLDQHQAGLAYLISLSAVRHMIDHFGMYRVRIMLDELAAGKDSAAAIHNGLLVSAEDFERGWIRSLE
ncbi:MAG: tetratricopeptide repeat protein [Nitrospirota bacterium]|nr:tetratricopeptide repeat protein [Nitrospirota bacterium]